MIGARGALVAWVVLGLALLAVLTGAEVSRAAASSNVANRSGRLVTTTLCDLGARTSALYVFASDRTSFEKQTFWQSSRGAFDGAKAKLAGGDFNADGFPDVLVLYDLGEGKSALYAFLSNGAKYGKMTAWQGNLPWAKAKLSSGDVNGDGATDAFVLALTSATSSTLFTFTSSSTPRTDGKPAPVKMQQAVAFSGAYSSAGAQIAAADVNADGRDELVSLVPVTAAQARFDVFAGKGNLTRTVFWSGSLAAARVRLACGDVDSDGRGDAVLFADAGGGRTTLSVLRSEGNAFSAPQAWWAGGAGQLAWATTAFALGDVTSDGKADAVLLGRASATTGRMIVAVSDGTAFAAAGFWNGTLRTAGARLACASSLATVVPDTTEVLPPATVGGAASTDGSTYTFANSADTAAMKPGDVIVGEPTAALPGGIFRKVTAVSGASVSTEAAALEDAIENGEFSVDHAIKASDFTDAALKERGVTVVRARAGAPDPTLITLRFKNVDIARDWTLTGYVGPVTVSGTITLRITVHVEGKVSWGQVKSFEVGYQTTVTSDLRAEVGSNDTFGASKTLVEWGAGDLLGFTVWVGPVPLCFQPELGIVVGAEGQFKAGVVTGVHYAATGGLGASYRDDSFTAWAGFGVERSYTPPTLDVSGSIKAYAGPSLGLKLYTAAGPDMNLDGYLKLAADTNATPWWTLKCGLEASVGVSVGVDKFMIHWSKSWESGRIGLGEWTLAQADTPQDEAGEIAFVREGDIWIADADGTDQRQLTATGNLEADPFWSSDGESIYFSRMVRVTGQTEYGPQGEWALIRLSPDTRAEQTVNLEAVGVQTMPIQGDISPDGTRLAVIAKNSRSKCDLTVHAVATGATVLESPVLSDGRPVWGTGVECLSWSPDGRSLAFVSWETPAGGTPLCVVDAANAEIVRRVKNGGFQLDWSTRNKFAVAASSEPDSIVAVIDAFTGEFDWSISGMSRWPDDPAWSPDGVTLAYTVHDSEHGNSTQIMAAHPFDKGSNARLIVADGEEPAWRP